VARLRQKLDRAEWAKLPQDRQSDYIERDGTFFLDTEESEALRTAFDRTKGELTEAQRRLTALKDVDPDEYERLRKAAAEAERNKELEKGNFEKLTLQEREDHAKELKKRDDGLLGMRRQLEDSIVDGEIMRAITAKYPGAKVTPILLGAKQTVKSMEIGGKLRAVVVDEKGEPRLRPGAKTVDDYMGPADRVDEMRNDKEWAGNFPAGTVAQPATRSAISSPQQRALKDTTETLAQAIRDGATRVQ